MKSLVIASLILGTPLARAVENLECAWDLSGPREAEILPAHAVSLERGEVLIRGTLAPVLSAGEAKTEFAVRDEMIDQRILRPGRLGVIPLADGDRLWVLDISREQILYHLEFSRSDVDRVWIEGTREHTIKAHDPFFVSKFNRTALRMPKADLDRIFAANAPVVVARRLSEEGFARTRAKYLPSIEAYRAHLANPDRFVRLGNDESIELAHWETAHRGAFRYGFAELTTKTGKTVWELSLKVRDEGGRRVELEQHDTIVMIDREDHVVLKYTLEEENIIVYPPFDEFEIQLLRQLMFVTRAVIIKGK